MRKTSFTFRAVAFALRQAETGTPVAEVCRKMGVSEASYTTGNASMAGWGSASFGG